MGKLAFAAFAGVIVFLAAIGLSMVIYDGSPRMQFSEGTLLQTEMRGYTMIESEEGAGAEEDKAPFVLAIALATADAEKGAKVSKKCTSCHSFEKGGPHKVGPNLYNILGADVAHAGDYAYSDAMKSKGGTWTYENFYAFIAKPKGFVPGTKMTFAGLRKPQDTADLIAYIRSLSDNAPALPAVPAPQGN